MREIKFRVWNGEFFEYSNFNFKTGNLGCNFSSYVELDTPQQFTGFQDCNGVDIYEGDILCVTYSCDYEKCQVTVKFDGGALYINVEGCDYAYTAIGWALENCNIEALEVIGNIYEK